MIKINKSSEGFSFVIKEANKLHQLNPDNIEKIDSESGISTIVRIEGDSVIVSKNLIYFEKYLEAFDFIRINRNQLINMHQIKFVDCKERTVLMKSDEKMTVSVRNVARLCQKMCGKQERL